MKKLLLTFISMMFLSLPVLAESKQVIDVNIEGMSCKFCAYSVQKALSKMPGVEKAQVNIETKKAHIIMSEGQTADIDLIKKNISDSGFTPVKVTQGTLK